MANQKMKKVLSVFLAISMLILCMPAVFAAEEKVSDAFAQQTVSALSLGAFEGDTSGYIGSLESFDGKAVRSLKRDGKTNTSTNFNYFHYSTPLPDDNGNPIPLSTANYIVIEYYYASPDESPALVGNKMGWIQGRVTSGNRFAEYIEFAWNTRVMSRNGMVANKWDKLVLPFDESLGNTKDNTLRRGEVYLQQLKFYPLEKDMGKDDALYISSVTFQSWDPDTDPGFTERNVSFYASLEDYEKGAAPAKTVKVKDLEYITIPEFSSALPENMAFKEWQSVKTDKICSPGTSYQFCLGQDDIYVPVFEVSADFSNCETSYVNGYEDGTFKPQNNITRAEACKIIASLVDPTGKLSGGASSYQDIKPEDWFYSSVTSLEKLGAVQKVFAEKLLPSEKITRKEFVQLIYAVSGSEAGNLKLSYFSDVNSKSDYFEAVMFASAKGFVNGYEDGTFKPNNEITRAEAVTVINRMLGREWNGAGDTKFSDISDHWAKGQIIASASSKADGTWTLKTAEKEYVLEGASAKDYITALHTQSKNLTGDAIRRGIDTISEQMKKDILGTPNTTELYADRIGKNVYYISEKNGNDANDGKTPATALKTIQGLMSKLRFPGKGTAILFERGGTYRGSLTVNTGLTYGSYGEGEKPIISGSNKNYADPNLWVETDTPNVYRLTDALTNVGIIVFDHADNAHGNYDGLYGQPRIFNKNIATYKELSKDLEFFSCANTLYLCSTGGNPGSRFKDIEIGTRTDLFDGGASDIVIDNLHFKHTGSHAIGLGSGDNVVVTNCEFSWLGGSLLGNYGETTTQYGNAVELYGNCDGYYVRNCWMYQIYDTAITHQGKNLNMKNIQYEENLMEYCHWAIECWMTQPDSKGSLNNYSANYNVMRNGGYGWGTIVTKRPSTSMLYATYSLDVPSSNLTSKYNVLDRCAGYLINYAESAKEDFSCHIYVQDEGMILGGLRGKAANADAESPFLLNKHMKDESPVFVLITK
ncbi:MAG: S-layer homology domain-containing protein [Ruminococcaceae bacterium]|nr:S-layer homology domain-containing protein [Oscillospiraceae bacterium]